MSLDNSAAAFPPTPYTPNQTAFAHGMSLRDYFAAKAANALLQTTHINGLVSEQSLPMLAGLAYQVADANLTARRKK